MMQSSFLDDYRLFVRKSNAHYDTLGYLGEALELIAEAGEVMELFQKHHRRTQQLDSRRLKDELSDVLWAVTALADKLGCSLEDVARYNQEKLTKRQAERA